MSEEEANEPTGEETNEGGEADQGGEEVKGTEQQESTPIDRNAKVQKVQVDQNASFEELEVKPFTLTSFPTIPEEAQSYSPALYTFRVKVKPHTKKLRHVTTRAPPFYLLVDHALAVVWTLFSTSSDKEKLGIVQLHWALYFLQSLYNNDGMHPHDIQLCIDAIFDYLIDEYADISEESVLYGKSRIGDYFTDDDGTSFSVNYSQMINKCPDRPPDEIDYGINDPLLLVELENIKKVVGMDKIDVADSGAKDKTLSLLSEWKKEQIDKIQEEVKMLRTVEDMIKNVDSENFEGYTDEAVFILKEMQNV